ncbi:MAG: restriction endonuclease PLD domain-containing protein [Pseudomonadota bacterium]
MGQILVTNGFAASALLTTGGAVHEIQFRDHFTLLRQLIGIADGCLLEAPFLYADFAEFLAGLEVRGKEWELITSAKQRGDDQLRKPYALRSFGSLLLAATGKWPTIHLNDNLHSKIYLFRKGGQPFAGVVTSANLTHAGLCTSHETGLLIEDVAQLRALDAIGRQGLEYVHLAEHQVERMCWYADEYRKLYGNEERDVNAGLQNFLNQYATPSAGNRNIRLTSTARHFIKVSGVKDDPILPKDRRPFAEPHGKLAFAKSPGKSIVIGDCLLEVAVGGQCFLSYHACASEPHERTEREKESNPKHKRWPHYVYANNLSLHYGQLWFEAPIGYEATIQEFKREYPEIPVTQAGGDNLMGAIQMGNSYFQVTREFGEFVRKKNDAFVPPAGKG